MKHTGELIGKIPIKPHLLQYVKYKEGLKDGDPLVLRGDTLLTKHLSSLLTHKQYIYEQEIRLEFYAASLDFIIPHYKIERSQMYVSDRTVVLFNDILYRQLNEELDIYIKIAVMFKKQKRIAILEFMEMTGIDEDMIAYESLARANRRLNKQRKTQSFTEEFVRYILATTSAKKIAKLTA